ncbi:MAG: hypothetical protein Q8P97_01725 [bacterium]|nr:hypothetical protein [bacterium]
MDDENITWEAPEFIYHEKTALWYWASIAVTLLFLALALYGQNFLFAVFIILAEILLIVWSREIPPVIKFVVTKDGVGVGEKKFYRFEELASFSLLDSRHGMELILRHKGRLGQYVKIPLTDQHIELVESALLEKLPKKDYEESLPDSLFRLIKF